MSRTDKTVPHRVREYREGTIEHDHINGRCVIETREQALEHSVSSWKRYVHDCPRRKRIEYECPGYCPAEDGRISACWSARTLWKRKFDELPDTWEYFAMRNRFHKRRVFCAGSHIKHVFHPEIACDACDSRPTCEYDLNWSYVRLVGGAPRAYTQFFHGIERRNERDMLNAARRDWNTHGETDIEPGRVFQRHSANWYYC